MGNNERPQQGKENSPQRHSQAVRTALRSQYRAQLRHHRHRYEWIQAHSWRCVVLDEAQAIKNPATAQSRAARRLKAGWRVALTGTPIENRLGDLWSTFNFLNRGLLGSTKEFDRACKVMADSRHGYAPLRRRAQPFLLRRLKTDR